MDNYEKKKRELFSIVEKLKSSVRNNYCLFCRSEIIEKNHHHCKEVEMIGDKILNICLQIGEKKEIIEELNSDLLKNQEFAQNIKNKIIAYNI